MLLALVGCHGSATSPIVGRYVDNAVWLGHGYVVASSTIARVPDAATRLSHSYGVETWFVNAGLVDATGKLPPPAAAAEFLNSVSAWELANGRRLEVIAWATATPRRPI